MIGEVVNWEDDLFSILAIITLPASSVIIVYIAQDASALFKFTYTNDIATVYPVGGDGICDKLIANAVALPAATVLLDSVYV